MEQKGGFSSHALLAGVSETYIKDESVIKDEATIRADSDSMDGGITQPNRMPTTNLV
jgi:hypothetical protein